MLLNTLLVNNDFTGWSIFEAKNGTNLNLRFSGEPSECGVDKCSYRRVSGRQAVRNRERARTYRDKHRAATHVTGAVDTFSTVDIFPVDTFPVVDTHPVDTFPAVDMFSGTSDSENIKQTGPITRSRANQDTEILRSDMSFDTPGNISVSTINMTPICSISPGFDFADANIQTEQCNFGEISTQTDQCDIHDSNEQTKIVIFPHLEDDKVFQIFEIDYSPDTLCDNFGCIFAKGDSCENFAGLFPPLLYCPECDISVCERCYNLGTHQHHEDKIFPYKKKRKP